MNKMLSFSSWMRKEQVIESAVRQATLEKFWMDEQIRVRPNMKFLLSEVSFEKDTKYLWEFPSQLMAQASRGLLEVECWQTPILRSKDGTLYNIQEMKFQLVKKALPYFHMNPSHYVNAGMQFMANDR